MSINNPQTSPSAVFTGLIYPVLRNCNPKTSTMRIKWGNTFLWFRWMDPLRSISQSSLLEMLKSLYLTSQAHRWFRSCLQCICSSPAPEGRSRSRRRSRRTADPGSHAWLAVGCSPEVGRSQRIARRTEQRGTTGPQSLKQTAGGQCVGAQWDNSSQKHTPLSPGICSLIYENHGSVLFIYLKVINLKILFSGMSQYLRAMCVSASFWHRLPLSLECDTSLVS